MKIFSRKKNILKHETSHTSPTSLVTYTAVNVLEGYGGFHAKGSSEVLRGEGRVKYHPNWLCVIYEFP